MDLYRRQAQNRRRTLAFLLFFVAAFAALGLGLDVAAYGFLAGGEPLPLATIAATLFSSGLALNSYFNGSRLVIASLLATPLRLEVVEHRQLHNIVTEMALAAGLPLPRIFVIPDPAPNALATGRDPAHAAIAVTEGALILLDREETQGVVAHEMAHIANRDTLLMTAVGVLLGGLVMLADWARRGVYFGRGGRRRGGPWLVVVVVLLALITPLLSRLLAMAISRQREYLADATAAELTRNPLGLASALEKIGAAATPLRTATRGTAHLFISDPLRRWADAREGRLGDLLATHPPLARRIAVLRALAQGGTHE
ncbi:MAG: M48 family metallopeptidase [Deltaproteobacteria bacterium]|nr:M48 family metallopeptidase [Deltaproteobacteria bacterium]